MNTKLIAANLKHLRRSISKTQYQFSIDFNVSEAALRKWESGIGITLATAIRYSKEFNVTLDDLCFKELSINPKNK